MKPQNIKLKKIHLRDTDATGVLYFTEKLRMALEAFEDHFSLKEMMEKEDFLMPIVHAEADYTAPLTVGDEVEIHLSCSQIGETSFTLSCRFFLKGKEVGKTSIVHVVVSQKTKRPMPIPPKLRALLV